MMCLKCRAILTLPVCWLRCRAWPHIGRNCHRLAVGCRHQWKCRRDAASSRDVFMPKRGVPLRRRGSLKSMHTPSCLDTERSRSMMQAGTQVAPAAGAAEMHRALVQVEDLKIHFPLDSGETVKAVDGVSLAAGQGDTLSV